MRFNLEKVVHIPGKEMYTSDGLSRPIKRDSTRAPNVSQDSSFVSEAEMNSFVECVCQSIPASDMRIREIREAQNDDDVCKKIWQYFKEGWPERQSIPDLLNSYWSERGEISVVKGVILESLSSTSNSNTDTDVFTSVLILVAGILKR